MPEPPPAVEPPGPLAVPGHEPLLSPPRGQQPQGPHPPRVACQRGPAPSSGSSTLTTRTSCPAGPWGQAALPSPPLGRGSGGAEIPGISGNPMGSGGCGDTSQCVGRRRAVAGGVAVAGGAPRAALHVRADGGHAGARVRRQARAGPLRAERAAVRRGSAISALGTSHPPPPPHGHDCISNTLSQQPIAVRWDPLCCVRSVPHIPIVAFFCWCDGHARMRFCSSGPLRILPALPPDKGGQLLEEKDGRFGSDTFVYQGLCPGAHRDHCVVHFRLSCFFGL